MMGTVVLPSAPGAFVTSTRPPARVTRPSCSSSAWFSLTGAQVRSISVLRAARQAGLKAKTGLGMATLIIAANLPDVDAIAARNGGRYTSRSSAGVPDATTLPCASRKLS